MVIVIISLPVSMAKSVFAMLNLALLVLLAMDGTFTGTVECYPILHTLAKSSVMLSLEHNQLDNDLDEEAYYKLDDDNEANVIDDSTNVTKIRVKRDCSVKGCSIKGLIGAGWLLTKKFAQWALVGYAIGALLYSFDVDKIDGMPVKFVKKLFAGWRNKDTTEPTVIGLNETTQAVTSIVPQGNSLPYWIVTVGLVTMAAIALHYFVYGHLDPGRLFVYASQSDSDENNKTKKVGDEKSTTGDVSGTTKQESSRQETRSKKREQQDKLNQTKRKETKSKRSRQSSKGQQYKSPFQTPDNEQSRSQQSVTPPHKSPRKPSSHGSAKSRHLPHGHNQVPINQPHKSPSRVWEPAQPLVTFGPSPVVVSDDVVKRKSNSKRPKSGSRVLSPTAQPQQSQVQPLPYQMQPNTPTTASASVPNGKVSKEKRKSKDKSRQRSSQTPPQQQTQQMTMQTHQTPLPPRPAVLPSEAKSKSKRSKSSQVSSPQANVPPMTMPYNAPVQQQQVVDWPNQMAQPEPPQKQPKSASSHKSNRRSKSK